VAIKVKRLSEVNPWWLTTFYGPQDEQEKVVFLTKLRQLQSGWVSSWLLCGDFNVIYKAADKNNNHLNR
jgi:exonuclease III